MTFPYESCKIFRNTYYVKHLQMAASESSEVHSPISLQLLVWFHVSQSFKIAKYFRKKASSGNSVFD